VSRLSSITMLFLAVLCLALPLPAHATGKARAGTRGHSSVRTRHPVRQGNRARCILTVKTISRTVRKPGKKRMTEVPNRVGCIASSKLRSRQSRAKHGSALVDQFAPHFVGDIFGVGSFVTQRSSDISPLLVGRARELGTKWVREEFTASRLHADTTGRYWWTDYDRIVNQERKAGLQILGLLDYSNTWSLADHGTMPHGDMRRLTADFARYVYAVVRHFRGRVRYWEIWNEPNVDTFWHPSPDPTDYAALLNAAGSAVKRADPRARIVLAGTSGVDLGFIRAVAAHTRRFDIVAVHPYRNLPEPSFLKQVKALRGLNKPIWFSEIGWPAGAGCGSCYGEVEQARYLVRFYALAAAAGIQRVFWYDLRDDPHTASNPEAHFGLLRRDLSAKPAFIAYAYLSRLLNGSRYVGADWLGQHGLYTVRFRRDTTNIAVLWNASNTTRKLTLKWNYPDANLINAGGDILAELTPSAGHVSVIAPQGGEPFYLVDRLPSYHVPALGALLHFAPPAPPPTMRHTARAARTRRMPAAGKAAWVSPTRHGTRDNHASAAPHREHSVPMPKPHATVIVGPSNPVLTPPPAP
jgi:hypothetical protein